MCAMPEHLDWIKLYRAALHETDPEKQPAPIEEAKNAMKQALRMAIEYEDSDQRHAISEALSHLENKAPVRPQPFSLCSETRTDCAFAEDSDLYQHQRVR